MTYLSGKAQKRKNYTRYSIYVVVFLLVVIAWPYIRKSLYSTIEPAVVGYGDTKQSFIFFPEFLATFISTRQSLVTQQNKLEQEIERLENQLAEKEALLREGHSEATTSQETTSKKPVITMYPLMEDVTKIYSTILLSKGFKDGITVGDMVYLRGNQVVCTIKEVYNASSLCGLLSSSGVVTEGVTSSSSITLSLVGRGGHFLADIARDTQVFAGETVYLRSNPTMILGTVKYIANNNQDTSWHVFVEGAYNPITSSIFYVQP